MGWDMGVYTHWGGAGTGGDGGYRGVYYPPPEHGCTVHCDLSYHGIVYDGGAESGTALIQLVMGQAALDILRIRAVHAAAERGEEIGTEELDGEG